MRTIVLVPVVSAGLLLAGCGASRSKQVASPTPTPRPATTTTTATATGTPRAPSPLQAEANATASGDIPDNQVFIAFRNTSARYSLKYPEGWAQQGSGTRVTFRDKNNVVRIVVSPGGPRSIAQIRADLTGAHLTQSPQSLSLAGGTAYKVVYRTVSAPNAVTGKRVTLTVDRYYLPHGGNEAVVDLGTPVGVDNVDAYRLMIESFRWR